MRTFLLFLWQLLRALPLLLVLPFLILFSLLALLLSDLLPSFRKPKAAAGALPAKHAASIVIPNWNGRDLLEKYLPSVVQALESSPASEIIVVDNGSSDGSADFVRRNFPTVRLLALEQNLGFGGGSNAGFRAAKHDIVVLLNSDMRVAPDFLQPLLDDFTSASVFAVGCQIFFSDPNKVREETGLTQAWWDGGMLRVRHRLDNAIQSAYPCSYPGGGSSAFDRNKFLELGGFDPLLAPFYMEDTDLGYLAWKRGWQVLYEPRSHVYHEHRGTIGKRFSTAYIDRVIKKNFILFCWKNIHEWKRLLSHFLNLFAGAALSLIFGNSPERPSFPGLWRAFLQLPAAIRSRRSARQLARISDSETFLRPLGGYFRDRFEILPKHPQPLRVLFVAAYPMCPPVHGGAVFMLQTATHLARLADLNLIVLLDHEWERDPHRELESIAASTEYVERLNGKQKRLASIQPHAVTEFANSDLEWLIHRQIYTRKIDVIQLEYTALAQYGMQFHQLGCVLFEHDIYFQSIARQLPKIGGPVQTIQAAFEYLRAFRFEMQTLPRFDRVQVCSPENGRYLTEFLPKLAGRIDPDLRAGIDPTGYRFQPEQREPFTMLFLGSFRHTPNQVGLNWFLQNVMPHVLRSCPQARLAVVGSDPPPRHGLPDLGESIELRGFVEDVHEPLGRYAVFVCPILSGSGMRVKLLEAFASGIPVVSTRLGAEGLAISDGDICALADQPEAFANQILDLFRNPSQARAMACRARQFVMDTKDISKMTERLVENYRAVLGRKRRDRSGMTP